MLTKKREANGGGARTWTFGLNLPMSDAPDDVPRLLEHAADALRRHHAISGLDVLNIAYNVEVVDGEIVPGLLITIADDDADPD
jgi:hypothetical protein